MKDLFIYTSRYLRYVTMLDDLMEVHNFTQKKHKPDWQLCTNLIDSNAL